MSDSQLLTLEHSDPEARVLVVTNMWPHGENPGYGIFIKRQVDSLLDAGLRCDVLFVRGYRSQLAFVLAAAKLAAANFRGKRYQLVHAHSGETAFSARFFVRAPLLVSYCGDDLLGTPRADGSIPLAHRVRRWIIRQQARMQTATLTKSREMEGVLPRGVRNHNSVVPNGVDRAAFVPIDCADARRQLGWSEDERVALFAADPAVERKRHWLAKAACDLAAEQIPGVRLHVAYPSPPEQMPVLMSAADCLLLTSTIEGSPNVVKEALMCGLPVIATPSGDVRELLDGVEPSWVCESDAAELAGAVIECLRDPGRSNGRQASEWLGSERIAARVLELYNRLAPGSAP